MHVYRWDLDRTYLDTDIHSVRGLIRTALESASDKRTLPGAAALMRALTDADPSSRVFILSGSPTQMRDVLREKLTLDGVRFDRVECIGSRERLYGVPECFARRRSIKNDGERRFCKVHHDVCTIDSGDRRHQTY